MFGALVRRLRQGGSCDNDGGTADRDTDGELGGVMTSCSKSWSKWIGVSWFRTDFGEGFISWRSLVCVMGVCCETWIGGSLSMLTGSWLCREVSKDGEVILKLFSSNIIFLLMTIFRVCGFQHLYALDASSYPNKIVGRAFGSSLVRFSLGIWQ